MSKEEANTQSNEQSTQSTQPLTLFVDSLDSIPDLPEYNHNGWIERRKQVNESKKFNNRWTNCS